MRWSSLLLLASANLVGCGQLAGYLRGPPAVASLPGDSVESRLGGKVAFQRTAPPVVLADGSVVGWERLRPRKGRLRRSFAGRGWSVEIPIEADRYVSRLVAHGERIHVVERTQRRWLDRSNGDQLPSRYLNRADGAQQRIRAFALTTGRLVASPSLRTSARGRVEGVVMARSPDGNRLALGEIRRERDDADVAQVEAWVVDLGSAEHTRHAFSLKVPYPSKRSPTLGAAVGDDGRLLFGWSALGKVAVARAEGDRVRRLGYMVPEQGSRAFGLHARPDGDWLVLDEREVYESSLFGHYDEAALRAIHVAKLDFDAGKVRAKRWSLEDELEEVLGPGDARHWILVRVEAAPGDGPARFLLAFETRFRSYHRDLQVWGYAVSSQALALVDADARAEWSFALRRGLAHGGAGLGRVRLRVTPTDAELLLAEPFDGPQLHCIDLASGRVEPPRFIGEVPLGTWRVDWNDAAFAFDDTDAKLPDGTNVRRLVRVPRGAANGDQR